MLSQTCKWSDNKDSRETALICTPYAHMACTIFQKLNSPHKKHGKVVHFCHFFQGFNFKFSVNVDTSRVHTLPTMPIGISAPNLTLSWTLKNVSHKIWKEGKRLCGLLALMRCFITLLFFEDKWMHSDYCFLNSLISVLILSIKTQFLTHFL